MRRAAILALAALWSGGSALAQAPVGHRQPSPSGTLRGSAPARSDAEAEAARSRSEAKLREREDKARRALKGICNGC